MQAHEKIRNFREQHKWSQEEMAAKLNLSVSGYAKIEQGKSSPNLQRLQAIADVLGIEMVDLMPDSDNNMICLINEGDLRQGHNFYSGSQAMMIEVERLQVMQQNTEALLAQKDAMIKTLEEQIQTQRELISVLQKTEK